jgi:hypothetical protein
MKNEKWDKERAENWKKSHSTFWHVLFPGLVIYFISSLIFWTWPYLIPKDLKLNTEQKILYPIVAFLLVVFVQIIQRKLNNARYHEAMKDYKEDSKTNNPLQTNLQKFYRANAVRTLRLF